MPAPARPRLAARAAVLELAREKMRFGYCRLYVLLRPEAVEVNSSAHV